MLWRYPIARALWEASPDGVQAVFAYGTLRWKLRVLNGKLPPWPILESWQDSITSATVSLSQLHLAYHQIPSNSMILFLLQGGDYSEKGDAWGVITRTGRWSWWSWWSWVLSEPRPERLTTSRCCLDTSFDDRLQTVSRGEILSAFRCFWFFWVRIILTFTGRGCCHLSLCSADRKPRGHAEVWEEFGFPFWN